MSAQILIAVKSCDGATRFGANKIIHDTWGKDVRDADLRFFVGRDAMTYHQDEVQLDCGDRYDEVSDKLRAILRWSLDRNYDFTVVCDTDTFVVPERLLKMTDSHWPTFYDLCGRIDTRAEDSEEVIDGVRSWPSGGAGFWLSKRAAQIIVASTIKDFADDRLVGRALAPALRIGEITSFHDWHYDPTEPPELALSASAITRHFGGRTKGREYDPTWQYKLYAELRK